MANAMYRPANMIMKPEGSSCLDVIDGTGAVRPGTRERDRAVAVASSFSSERANSFSDGRLT